MSNCNKEVIQNEVYDVSYASHLEPILLEKYWKLYRLLRLLTLVFKFTNKLKHSDSDQSFDKEIQYLQNSQTEQIPKSVTNLNLFLDENVINNFKHCKKKKKLILNFSKVHQDFSCIRININFRCKKN